MNTYKVTVIRCDSSGYSETYQAPSIPALLSLLSVQRPEVAFALQLHIVCIS